MGYIINNGINYFGDNSVTLTQAQYDALEQAGTVDPHATYFITDRSTGSGEYAADVVYDNTNSGLSSANVQNAIDEVVDRIYPVGSIYMSVTDSTVAQVEARFGGTWEAFGDDGNHNHGFTQPTQHSFTPTTNTVTNPTFTGTAANISTVQPYITCYMYKRIA